MSEPVDRRKARAAMLWRYFSASWVLLLLNETAYLASLKSFGLLTALYSAAVLVSGSFLLLFLAFLPVLALHRILPADGPAAPIHRGDGPTYAAATAVFSLVQGFILFDRFLYGLYGFHLNGFVWNLVTTPGGVSSMGAGASTVTTFIVIGIIIVAVQTSVLVVILASERLRRLGEGKMTRRRVAMLAAGFVVLTAVDKVAYAVSDFRAYGPVISASGVFPLYIPVTCSTLLRKAGFSDTREDVFRISAGHSRLAYPLHPVERDAGRKPLNVIWLVAESLRADMLDPEIMPALWKFSERGVRFTRHYSGGNGTRMGMFSMFYGLYGNSFAPCMAELKSPVLMDVIQESGYQLFLYTSASFSFPELDKTVFAHVPREQLRQGSVSPGWARDRENVGHILQALDSRDPEKPFLTFMFFESPHSPYGFPDDCIIKEPCARDLNYLTMDLNADIGRIKNSYVNACRHLDTQLDRIQKHLVEKRLLESTIVLITGDHGEEFKEKGWWGHGSAFTEEQVRVPLVLLAPGVAPAVVHRQSSHADIPATVLTLLGIRNPPSDYSLGDDLLAGRAREYAVISSWGEIAYVDERFKAVFPLQSYNVIHRPATTTNDAPAESREFMAASHDRLVRVMADLRRFQK